MQRLLLRLNQALGETLKQGSRAECGVGESRAVPLVCGPRDPAPTSLPMNLSCLKRTLAGLALSVATLAPIASAQIVPAGITGTGTYFNSANLIIDGFVPAEMTAWTDSVNTFWDWSSPSPVSFTIDLGGSFVLFDALVSVDNNDDYLVEYSLDGSVWNSLLLVTAGVGEIPVAPGGMDTMTTAFGDGEYEASIDFGTANARFLRVTGLNGDGLFSVGEVQVWGRELAGAVPEPSTYGLMGAAVLAGLVAFRRRLARR